MIESLQKHRQLEKESLAKEYWGFALEPPRESAAYCQDTWALLAGAGNPDHGWQTISGRLTPTTHGDLLPTTRKTRAGNLETPWSRSGECPGCLPSVRPIGSQCPRPRLFESVASVAVIPGLAQNALVDPAPGKLA